MKIKNIQEYRSFYKNEIRDLPTRDENFIGNFLIEKQSQKKKFGWFEIYHGDKEGYGRAEAGIENFLQSFLDMAKDGQAVYEFLQNAVDAGSTHYAMVWGKDEIDGNHYLLVANNGKMFNLDSIRSILNVGSSTKTSNSQTIGKFGIGFKLAHRLVGKENGLQELINENSGPILFSWKNYEIDQIANNEEIEPQPLHYSPNEKGNYNLKDDHPWLFKILITCFPCLPQNAAVTELPKMANGEQSTKNPFSTVEYEVLSRWIKKNQNILNKNTYKEGSLFFIRLGSGKEEELAEENLREGVKFAIAILKETAPDDERSAKLLETVQLNNDEPITYPDLEYIKLTIDKETEKDTYAHIRFGTDNFEDLNDEQKRKITEEANIEALFGFRKYSQIDSFFKGAPNLYLYFPLSEEVHNFNYILHSNAFYKGSSRTFLHKGNHKEDGINERLLKVIVIKIEEKLKELSSSEKQSDQSLFLHFYASLLTSGKSNNQDRLWIEVPYINPVNQILTKYIPVQNLKAEKGYSLIKESTKVFIKKTQVDIDPPTWGLKDVNWLYWNLDAYDITAKASFKLGIQEYSIFDLLKNNGIEGQFNAWINGEDEKIKLVLKELSAFEGNVTLINEIRPQLVKLKLFRFSNGDLLSLSEFLDKEKQGYLLLHNTLGEVSEILIKTGIITTAIDLDEYKFVDIYRTYLLQTSKHGSYIELTKLFSTCAKDESLVNLSASEKLKLFNAFRTLNTENVTERIKELKLFTNNLGRPVAFKSLLSNQHNTWLRILSISSNEIDDQVKSFLLNDRKEIYQSIIYPFWSEILTYISTNKEKAKEIFSDLTALYQESSWPLAHQHLLSNQDLIIYNSEILRSDRIFFSKVLSVLPEEKFRKVQSVGLKFYNVYIPDQNILAHLDELPLQYSSISIDPVLSNMKISKDDIDDLMLFSYVCEIDFFEKNVILFNEGQFLIDSTTGLKQYDTSKNEIVNYIIKHHSDHFALLPKNINVEVGKIRLIDSALVIYLIEIFKEDSMERELDLIELVLNERYDDKRALIDKLTYLKLDTLWVERRQNELYLKLLNEIVSPTFTVQELTDIQNKILIYENETEVFIGQVESAHDSVEVKRNEKTLFLSQSQILNLEDAGTIKLIQDFHDSILLRNLVDPAKADKLFKISKVGVTTELIGKFESNLKNLNILKDALPLNNSHQLAFVLYSDRYSTDDLKKFAVKCQDEKWYYLNGTKIIHSATNSNFIRSPWMLSECYEDLQSVLLLNDLDVYSFNDEHNNLIAPKFLFVKGLKPQMLMDGQQTVEKLDYLYSGWKILPSTVRDYKRNDEWKSFLGIEPSQFVFDGIHIEIEILPRDFTDWSQEDNGRRDLLKALGINVKDKYLESLRLYLLKESAGLINGLELSKFNDVILLNTLVGLTGDFKNLESTMTIYDFTEDADRISMIVKIIAHLTDREIDCPLLVYHDVKSCKVVNHQDKALYKIDEDIHEKLLLDQNNQLNNVYHLSFIVLANLLVYEKINSRVEEISFKKVFEPGSDSVLHDEPFYHNWSRDNRINLRKSKEIRFSVYYVNEENEFLIGTIIDGSYYHSNEPDGTMVIHYNKYIHLDGLKSDLFINSSPVANLIGDLINKRDLMLASIYNAYNSASKDDVSNEHLQALHHAFREENLKQERHSLISNIKDSTKYSYAWFISYLEYLLTFSKNSEDNKKQKTIRFHTIKRQKVNEMLSNKYFLLCGGSSYISDSIEDVSDFSLSVLINNNKRFELEVEGAQKQGQDLLIFCPKGISKDVSENLNKILQLEITFIPQIDLLKELKNALVNRSYIDPWEQIDTVLPKLHFIYGPPGTGKTTTLCDQILDEVRKDINVKYLFLTPTNKAADVICKKLLIPGKSQNDSITSKLQALTQDNISLSVHRIGKPTDPEIENFDPAVYHNSIQDSLLNTANVIAMTIHRLPYTKVFDSFDNREIKLFKLVKHWDYVVFDEASMINLPYIIFAILSISKSSPNTKFIIAGDPKQIPPVVDANDKDLEELDIQDENIYSLMNIKSFVKKKQILRAGDTIENLDTQYRSVKKIGQLFSELSYSDLLKHYRETDNKPSKELPEAFSNFIHNNVTFIDVPLKSEESIYKIRQLFYSSYHIYSAILVSEIIKYFDSCVEEGQNWSIGLIAPYKAQAVMMNKLIDSFGISDKLKIYADTVHGFQGDECDIVFFISNPNNYHYTGHPKSLLSKEYIYNVAISRAKDYLVIIYPFSDIPGNPFLNKIKSSYHKNFENPLIKSSSDFENVLFRSKSFIYDNCYITGHDTVNVFGQIEKKYFIKANSNAVDIQLRDF